MAAGAQGSFFEFDELIFGRQREISKKLTAKAQQLGKPATEARSEDVQREVFIDLAAELGLDVGLFRQDLEGRRYLGRVRQGAAEAPRLGVTGTPGSFVNGRYLSGAQPFARFRAQVSQELTWAKEGTRPSFKKGQNVAQLRPASNRRSGPDPSKVYDLKPGVAPAQGLSGAKVTILHYLDYQ